MNDRTITELIDELNEAIDHYDQVVDDPVERYESLEIGLLASRTIATHVNRARITALREARVDGMSASDIADHLGISRQRVHQLLRSGWHDEASPAQPEG